MTDSIGTPKTLRKIRIGEVAATGAAAGITLDDRANTYLWGRRGSGTTTLTQTIILGAVLDPDTAVWVIDVEGGFDTRPFIAPMLDHGFGITAPAVDWVATTWEEAATMAATAAELAQARHEQALAGGDQTTPRRVLIVMASGIDQLRNGGLLQASHADRHITDVVPNLISALRTDHAHINLIIAGKYGPKTALPAALLDRIAGFIAVGVIPDDEKAGVLGAEVYGGEPRPNERTQPATLGCGQARMGSRTHAYTVLLDPLTPDTLTDAVLHDRVPVTVDELNGNDTYTTRWVRTLPALAGPDGVPPRLAKLGLPTLPTDVSEATTAQLAYALRNSPSVAGPAQSAAAELLITACGGQLLGQPGKDSDFRGLRDAFHIAGGALYVRWTTIADTLPLVSHSSSYRGINHPDKALVMHIIAALATGGLTADTVDDLLTTLGTL